MDVYWAEDLIDRVDYQIRMGYFDHLLKTKPMTGIELISQERQEQLTKHGRTVQQDKELNTEYQLTDAASALAVNMPEGVEAAYIQGQLSNPPIGWNKNKWEEMLKKPYKERLAIAGALIAAEIDRIS